MRWPSSFARSEALVFGVSVLVTGAILHGVSLLRVAPDAPPPAPQGSVEAGPLVMGAADPLELLAVAADPAWLPPDEAHALFLEDAEGVEETAYFHLGGLAREAFGRMGAPPGGPAVPLFAQGPQDREADEHAIEAFGVASPGRGSGALPDRFLLGPRRQPLLPTSFTEPASPLASWQAVFSSIHRDDTPPDPFFDRRREVSAGPLRVTLPPVFLGALAAARGRPVFGGIDYTDPTGVGLPLLRVFGYEDAPLSPNFRVRDFATHDGAPLARIAPRLVQGLERLRASVGPFYVLSGYRHPVYNASVGGRRVSRHMAGQAADLYSPTRSSIELAREAVEAFGCGIGLGLGENTIHVDVRGYLATWTYPGAPLSEATFDLWVLMLCDRMDPERLGSLLQVEWTLADSLSEVDLLNRLRWLTDDDVRGDSVTKETAEALLQQRRLLLAAYVRSETEAHGPGAVLVDLSEGLPAEGMPLHRSFVPLGSPEADRLGVASLIEWVFAQRHERFYFVYAVRFPDGQTDVGIMTMGAASTPASRPADAAEEASPAPPVTPSGPPANRGAGWSIVVNSTVNPTEAERDAEQYRRLLAGTDHTVTIRAYEEDRPRYRVLVGSFPSAGAARTVLNTTLSDHAPGDAWLLPPGN